MNGKELIQILNLEKGPEVGIYMQEQVKWMLTNPDGKAEELQDFLVHFKSTRELENYDKAVEHVSKKAHV